MLEDASNQQLIDAWRQGDELAARVLVRRYMIRLTALARSRLSRKLSRRLDPEDIVMSAWRSFFVAAGDGRLTVGGDDDLWPLLVTMTLRKLSRQVTRQTARRRGVDLEVGLDSARDWQAAVSRDPSPAEAALLVDEVESLLASLDAGDREVLTRRLRGDDQASIAEALGCSERSVRRAMRRIRDLLERQGESPLAPLTAGAGGAEIDSDRAPPAENTSEAFVASVSGTGPTVAYTDVVLRTLVGQGGFDKVYRAVRPSDGAIVAVKYLKKKFWRDPRATRGLLDEVSRVSMLSHPNIIRHHGWGFSPRGAVFVVMEWVEGPNARDWALSTNPSFREILQCGATMASAVAAAHAAGIVHGDLTPTNVLRRGEEGFVLTDFGFARSLSDPARGHLGGTLGFLAPEQVSDAFGPVNERTDVYGLGGLVYWLLTRRPPMTGDDAAEILANVISSRPATFPGQSVVGVPRELERLLLRCLSKEPAERPASAMEVSEALREVLGRA